jgi:hypothetical protein
MRPIARPSTSTEIPHVASQIVHVRWTVRFIVLS